MLVLLIIIVQWLFRLICLLYLLCIVMPHTVAMLCLLFYVYKHVCLYVRLIMYIFCAVLQFYTASIKTPKVSSCLGSFMGECLTHCIAVYANA